MNEAAEFPQENLTKVKETDTLNPISSPGQELSENDHFGFESNEDICFKCKKVGEIYCCDNCFRSFHWKCIGNAKIKELTESTYAINFICEFCDQRTNCTKCNSIHPKQHFTLLDFSEDRSIFTIYKCTHCYEKIHKKCLELPLELLNKKLFSRESNGIKLETENLQHYICHKCIEYVGITEIITTQKICNSLGIENLYYYVLLNTESPIHKGWIEEFALRNHLKKFSGTQTFVSEFLINKTLYENPKIEKILAIRFPAKYKKTSISEVLKTIDSKSKQSLNDRYGDPDNFKFLVKWKYRDYTSLTWEDEAIVIDQYPEFRNFLKQKENECFLIECINNIEVRRNRSKAMKETSYKLLEYELNNEQKIISKLIMKKQEIDLLSQTSSKPFEEKMIELDEQNENSFLEMLEIKNNAFNSNKKEEHISLLIKYLEKIYSSEIILRPTLIITNNIKTWEETIIQSENKVDSIPFKYVKFEGTKKNTDLLKHWDFFICKNPILFKFQILLIDYNYFLYENRYLFENIPSFYASIFDQSNRPFEVKERSRFIEKAYLPFKSKIYKEIHLLEDSTTLQERENFITWLLNVNNSTKNPMKNCIYHDISFVKVKEYFHSEPNLKPKLEKKCKEVTKIFDNHSKEILNEGQRLSFLKFIMAFGLNIKKIEDMCTRMNQQNPIVWSSMDRETMIQVVKDYLSLFMAVISSNNKELSIKKYESNINYFLFNYQRETVLKRIIQLKKLKTEVEKSFDDHSKFVIKKPFMFFSSGQCKPFPLWNTYEDYTLGALIVEEGYQLWNNVINSKKWIDYHSELETRKICQFDSKLGTFTVQEKIVPIKKKVFHSPFQSEERIIEHVSHKIFEESQCEKNKSEDTETGREELPEKYGEYLLKKIRGSKEFKEFEYARLDDLNILQGHIAERGDSILLSLE